MVEFWTDTINCVHNMSYNSCIMIQELARDFKQRLHKAV